MSKGKISICTYNLNNETCSGKHYARGLCRKHYTQWQRHPELFPSDDPAVAKNPDDVGAVSSLDHFDDLLTRLSAREPSKSPATAPRQEDTEGIAEIRKYLAHTAVYKRRRIIRDMLFRGFTKADVLEAFITDPELRRDYVLPLKEPKRVIEDDIAAVIKGDDEPKESYNIDAKRQYIDDLEKTLRLAYRNADDTDLPVKDRQWWAKLIPETSEKLAIMRGVIHKKTGVGVVPVRSPNAGSDDDDEEYDDEDETFQLPKVRSDRAEEWIDHPEESEPTSVLPG